jgi:hypothetical protein
MIVKNGLLVRPGSAPLGSVPNPDTAANYCCCHHGCERGCEHSCDWGCKRACELVAIDMAASVGASSKHSCERCWVRTCYCCYGRGKNRGGNTAVVITRRQKPKVSPKQQPGGFEAPAATRHIELAVAAGDSAAAAIRQQRFMTFQQILREDDNVIQPWGRTQN